VAAQCRAASPAVRRAAQQIANYQAALRRFYESGGHRNVAPDRERTVLP
jgi:hypothetical protein